MTPRFEPRKICPVCKVGKYTHLVPKQPSDGPVMRRWVCDTCLIGWYDGPRSGPKTKLPGTIEQARALYIPIEKPREVPHTQRG